jgi:catechol 2,3-dioxygenase-like lactoylglutathione lyase family enzyme
MAMGWWAETEPWSFRFGGSELKNVVLRGSDGFNVALYERSSPPFTAFPVGAMSQGFNSMRMVRDQRASVAWHRRVLGFETVFETDFVDPAPTDGNFSIPRNYATRIVRRAAAMQPAAGETGRVELMQFVGFEGRDVSEHASPPNLGILSVRYPVRDLAGLRARVVREGGAIAYEAAAARTGRRTAAMFAVRDPDGSLTEFYQAR